MRWTGHRCPNWNLNLLLVLRWDRGRTIWKRNYWGRVWNDYLWSFGNIQYTFIKRRYQNQVCFHIWIFQRILHMMLLIFSNFGAKLLSTHTRYFAALENERFELLYTNWLLTCFGQVPLFFWFDFFLEARTEIHKYFRSFFGANGN